MSAVLKESPLTLEMIETEDHPAPAAQRTAAVAIPVQTGPMGNAIAWLQAGGTMAQLREMLDLQREFEADQSKKAYVAAMARFKKNPPQILKDKRVYFENKDGVVGADYWHATLGNVAEAIIDGLADVGISHSWKPERKEARIHVTCTLTHEQGHSESITLDGPLDDSGKKNSIQQAASTTTYLSRYTLLMITGLAVKDEIMPDDDGRSAAQPAAQADAAANTYSQDLFEKNAPEWRAVIQSNRKTVNALIAMVETKAPLTHDQKVEIASWAPATQGAPA